MTDTPTGFDVAAAEEVCRAVVGKQRRMFASVPHMTVDELFQECMVAVWRASGRYDPSKGASWKTWVGTCAYYRLVDLFRSCQLARKTEITSLKNTTHLESVQNLSDELPQVVDRAIEAAEGMVDDYASSGPHRFTRPQLVACIALRDTLKTSYRGVELALRNHPELRSRMGLKRVPRHTTLFMAHRSIRRDIRRKRMAPVSSRMHGKMEDD